MAGVRRPTAPWSQKSILRFGAGLSRTPDQQDAYATAEWLRWVDFDGSLEKFFCPELGLHERKIVEIEGWILGVL